ncbi:cation transporter [Agrococcus sp. HG114]|uniref:cation transporter n=1 Tax=Agrococcus sp. HG114 TaxID=2969757 RepID=UPI00215AEEBB|nr:cation transporter [Agrococcus sp. HG114]MCR8670538.1 cation transporter [Agrococcus sp. HG114]
MTGAHDDRDASARTSQPTLRALRRAALVVAGLNLAYFFVEFSVAATIRSASLMADSVDFLEDTAINVLIALAVALPLARRAVAGRAMALIILVPAAAAGWQVVRKALEPVAPDVLALVVTSGGAVVVNLTSAIVLARHRRTGGSMGKAAFLSARNDVLVNLAIIAMGVVTWLTRSGWPDVVLGVGIVAIALQAAWEVWEAAGEERLLAKETGRA